MIKHKYKIGQQVIYRGLIADIEGLGESIYGTIQYHLVAIKNDQLTCTADEKECELYTDQEIDQQPALKFAELENQRILGIIKSVL